MQKEITYRLSEETEDGAINNGLYLHVELDCPMTQELFEKDIVPTFRELKHNDDSPDDFIIVSFNYQHPAGVVFIQTSANSEGDHNLEIARYEENIPLDALVYEDDDGNPYKLYCVESDPSESSEEEVIAILRKVIVEEQCPELVKPWRDITEIAIKNYWKKRLEALSLQKVDKESMN
ncbi:MAG: hypothetical protein Q4D21_04415 [Phascolarctobacterium sp.]|nr:hypothetical protein [Phascolarctobacterium sp.]